METVSQFDVFIPLYQNSRRHRKKLGYRSLRKGYLQTNKMRTKACIRNKVTNATVMFVGMLLAQYSNGVQSSRLTSP